MRKYGIWIVLFLFVAFVIGQSVTTVLGKEETKIDQNEIFETIQKGYEAQFSIRDKRLPVGKMYDILSPYFTDNFLQVFTDENNQDVKRSAQYLLPTKEAPFTFSSKTKIVYNQEYNLLYVYERNMNTDEYQIITLQKNGDKWKMAGYHENKQLLSEIKKYEKE
ncbi:DUF3993 domain-containing protein [Bacillus sp. BP-3]|uniref:DUF3993 domain-containing protein n=1 Tax=Bacillus sp. BP-3 TaxID=3022773 RepID=UPI002330EC4A|nr:DUF3993 domain-containing protein [Bacillus sp. BP-3]MDC2864883.1 DUF3993 domain-containing protein [Bacillus sp. BP-3]